MEEENLQSVKTDASLYNGRPTDTGSSCPSARLTSCTLSISDDVSCGMSVENALTEKKQWFVLQVSYGRVIKAKFHVETESTEKVFLKELSPSENSIFQFVFGYGYE